MAISRYNRRNTITNIAPEYIYSYMFRDRGLRQAVQFPVAELAYPTVEQIGTLTTETVVWGQGDKYYKLAHEHYGDPDYWWVIAWYNQKPMEFQNKAGDVVEIPGPLELVLEYFKVY